MNELRERPVDHNIPDYVKNSFSSDHLKVLTGIRDDIQYKKPSLGEMSYAGTSKVVTSNGVLNYYSSMGFYSNTGDIPLTVIDAMRRDSQVALAMAIVKYPITNLGFTVDCDNPVIKEVVTYMLTPIFSKVLRDMTLAMDYGFVAFEKVWNNVNLSIDPGLWQRKVIDRNFTCLKKLKPLYPKTLSLVLDDYNNVIGVKQTGNITRNGDITLNKQKSLIITYQEEFGNFFGRTRYAPAYEPWYWKIIATQFFLRWMERHAIPPYMVRYPYGKSDTPQGEQDNNALALKMAQAISSYGNIVLPSRRDDKGNLIWDVESALKQSTGQSSSLALKDVVEEVFNLAIMRGMLVPDKTTTSGLDPDIATKIFISSAQDFVWQIQDAINEEIIKPFVYWNFSKTEISKCEINVDEIDFEKRQEMRKLLSKILDTSATFIKQLGGLPFDTFPDVNKIYEILDIPSKPVSLYLLKTIDANGKEVISDPNNNQNTNKGKGPDKGEKTSGNQSRTGRNGDPRKEDKADQNI